MAEEQLLALQVAELIVLAAAGYAVGKLVHFLALQAEKRLSGEGKHSIASLFLAESGGPLAAICVVVVVFLLSSYAAELSWLHAAMATYYLPIIIVLGAYLLAKLVGAAVRWRQTRATEQGKADLSLLPLAGKILAILIVFWGITLSMAAVGFDVTSFLTLSGVAAIIIGFAAQETLGNIIAGIALQLEGQFANGEYLRLSDGTNGRLRTIGWRSAELDNQDGDTIVLPNSELAKQQVTNLSRPKTDYKVHALVKLPAGSDFAKFLQYISKQLEGQEAVALGVKKEEAEVLVERVHLNCYSVDVSFWLSDCFMEDKARDFVNRKALQFRKENPVEQTQGKTRKPVFF